MRVVVTGAGGFIGGRLARELAARGTLDGQPIDELVVVDQVPVMLHDTQVLVTPLTGDVRDTAIRHTLFSQPIDGFFHLAATLTAEAERDFDKGISVNTVGLLGLLDECRALGKVRFVFSSSMAAFGAAFGGALPDIASDELPQRPTTSYGVQKVIAELLLDDYTRRGFLDGRALRLPVVLIRPEGAAPALSEFISAVVREPLEGRPVVCPFSAATKMPVASVGAVARALIALYEMPSAALGAVRSLNMPGLTVTIDEMLDALERRAGKGARDLVTWTPDAQLQGLLDAMPKGFTSARALKAGIKPEARFDEVIEDYIGCEQCMK